MMKWSISVVLILLLVNIVNVGVLGATLSETEKVPYFMKYTYMIKERQILDLVLNASDTFEYRPPAPPEGVEGTTFNDFRLYYVEIEVPSEIAQVIKLSGENSKIRVSENGIVGYRFYTDNPIRIENVGNSILITSLTINIVYVHEEWVEIELPDTKVNIPPPPVPFVGDNVTVMLEVPPYTPLSFATLITPNNLDLISLKTQKAFPPSTVDVSPRRIKFQLASLPFGTYLVGFEPARPLPASRIYKSLEIFNITIPAMSTRVIALPAPPEGWNFSHVELVVATISVIKPTIKGEVYVEAPLVDLAYGTSGLIPIKFIEARYALEAYVVYSSRFTIVNKLNIPIIVYLVPFVYREIGIWSPLGLTIKVERNDIGGATYAFLEVEIPNGIISEVTLPSNMVVTRYYDSKLPWSEDTNRTISCTPHYVLVQIAHDEVMETGTYSFKIDWFPIHFNVLDSKGRPLERGSVRLYDNETSIPQDIVQGVAEVIPYKPSIYRLEVKYKGTIVYDGFIGFPVKPEYTVYCKVYDLVIRVSGVRGQFLSRAVVNLTAVEGKAIVKVTNESGMACFEQLPIGDYQVKVSYRNVVSSVSVSLTDNLVKDIRLDVFIDVPGTNIALGADETAIIAIVFACIVTLIGVIIRRRHQEVILH